MPRASQTMDPVVTILSRSEISYHSFRLQADLDTELWPNLAMDLLRQCGLQEHLLVTGKLP